MRKRPQKGDLQRGRVIMILYKARKITWQNLNGDHFVIKIPVQCEMNGN